MQTHRAFLTTCACAVAMAALNTHAFARNSTRHVKAATAIRQVFGDGIRLTAVAVEYDAAVRGPRLSPQSFRVDGRRVTARPIIGGRQRTPEHVAHRLLDRTNPGVGLPAAQIIGEAAFKC